NSYAYTKPARRNPPGFWRSQKTLMPNTAHHVDERLRLDLGIDGTVIAGACPPNVAFKAEMETGQPRGHRRPIFDLKASFGDRCAATASMFIPQGA
ncbi:MULTISPECIES: hypothetical protein, partial [unclassified Agrobacterium]|uniref:hypothetical protein n=1 Tax=unclassified Agrobacterium TaxID=2632611 RepID=UPI00244A804F